jgi:hypothetical protein
MWFLLPVILACSIVLFANFAYKYVVNKLKSKYGGVPQYHYDAKTETLEVRPPFLPS